MRVLGALMVSMMLFVGCGDDGGTQGSPEATAERFAEALIESNAGAMYEMFDPELLTVPRSEFSACHRGSGVSVDSVEADAIDTFTEDGYTFVDVRVAAETATGPEVVTFTVKLSDLGDRWGVRTVPGDTDDDGESCLPES